MIPTRGLSLKIFVEGGDSEGLRLLERTGWIGKGIVCPRSLFPKVRNREEFSKPAVYILCGPMNNGDRSTKIYIGECDSAASRLSRHVREKKFWTDVILFCAKDDTLNKAHFRYLESRLLKLARDSQRVELENDNRPAEPKLSKVDSGEADAFLEDMLLFLSCIGVLAFVPPQAPANGNRATGGHQHDLFGDKVEARVGPPQTTGELFTLRSKSVSASGFLTEEGFLVQKGSQALPSAVPSAQDYVKRHRLSLFSEGKFRLHGKTWELVEDHTFSSATAAAAILLGRSVNGRIRWRARSGQSLRQIQDAKAGIRPRTYRWN